MKKNVVLLAINSKFIHSNLAVWIIKAGIEKSGLTSCNGRFEEGSVKTPWEVNVVEATIHQSIEEITENVIEFNPDVIGISTYIWNASMLPNLIKSIQKQLPQVKIVLGGPEAENNAKYWLSCGADYVLVGEGEYTFPAFLRTLSSDSPLFPSLFSMKESPFSSLHLPIEERHNPINIYSDEYIAAVENRIIYFESSRGCPFNCAYCMSAETKVEFFPTTIVKKRLCRLSQLDKKTIKFVDRTFNCNAERAYELFEYVIALNTNCCFHFEVAADLFDEETLALLKTAPPGQVQLEIGLQSFYKPTLDAISRKTNLIKATQNIKELLIEGNIHIHIDLIAGLPYETLQIFKNSFEQAYALQAHTLQLGFLKLLHGSVLRKKAEDFKLAYSPTPPYEIQSSPWLSEDDKKVLKHAENALQHTYNKGRFLRTLDYVISVSKMHPFDFYHTLGKAAPNHGTALGDYAVEILNICAALPNVEYSKLQDHMVCDWLSMVKGKNMPTILRGMDKRHQNSQRKQVFEQIKQQYAHEVRRDEVRILNNGKIAFVDNTKRNPVTGLYDLLLLTKYQKSLRT